MTHNIAAYWKDHYGDVLPFVHFDEYFLSIGKDDFYSHIHLVIDEKTKKPIYIVKINNDHVKRGVLTNKKTSAQWAKFLFTELKKYKQKCYKDYKKMILETSKSKSKFSKKLFKTNKNKTNKNKTNKNNRN